MIPALNRYHTQDRPNEKREHKGRSDLNLAQKVLNFTRIDKTNNCKNQSDENLEDKQVSYWQSLENQIKKICPPIYLLNSSKLGK